MALSRSKQALLEISNSHDKSNLLDQIFMFIGSKPEEAVSWKICVKMLYHLTDQDTPLVRTQY